jgi:xanthine dehydrogenase molybdenum-binding subunit
MEFSVVGKNYHRQDGMPKAKGTAQYIADLKFPNMLYGKIVRSPHAHAKVTHIDVNKAEALPGVKVILTPDDCPKTKFNMAGFPPGEAFPLPQDQLILTAHPLFVGDPICAVAAVSEEIAEEAVRLIEIQYQILPHVIDRHEAIKDEAPQFKEGGNVVSRFPLAWGDIDKAFEEADVVVQNRYTTQKAYQCTIEPTSGVVALWNDMKRLVVYSPTQMPHLVRRILATALEMRIGDIEVIKPHVGGGFGSRLGVIACEPIAALLSKKTGFPVRIIYTREESIAYSEQRHPVTIEIKTAAKEDGTLLGHDMRAIVDTGAYATHGPSIGILAGLWGLTMYKVPNVRYEGISTCTNTMYNGAYRGYGNPQSVWAVEQQMDQIAEKLNMDPLKLRLKNFLYEGDIWPWSGYPIESCGINECLEKGAKLIGWEEKRSKAPENSVKRKGLGLATMMHVSGAKPVLHELSSAFIKLNEDGTANLLIGSAEIGQGCNTALMQICAEELGINYEDVLIPETVNTDYTMFDIGSHASRQVYSMGNAVKKAASQAKEKLFQVASVMLGVHPNELDTKEGRIFVKSTPEKFVTHAQANLEAHFRHDGKQIWGACSENPPGNPPVYAVHFVEVEVDIETGEIKILNFVAAHDTGVIINPNLVQGQIQGAIQHGLGYALTEEVQICQQTGRVLNQDLVNYKIFTMEDMPHIDIVTVEAAAKSSSHGQKSVGESGLVPTAAAIGNAVYDAIGIRITDLPITPEKILKALGKLS